MAESPEDLLESEKMASDAAAGYSPWVSPEQLPSLQALKESQRLMDELSRYALISPGITQLLSNVGHISAVHANLAVKHWVPLSVSQWHESISRITEPIMPMARLADTLQAQFDFSRIAARFTPEIPAIVAVKENLFALDGRFQKLTESLASASLIDLPSFTVPLSTREVYLSELAFSHLIYTDTPEHIAEEAPELLRSDDSVKDLLCRIDPGLVVPYDGAFDSLGRKGIDYQRHVLSSLRQLWENLLNAMAPDGIVKAWAGDRRDLLHKNGPSRKARFLYVCRGYNHDPLSDFVEADADAFDKMYRLFNRLHNIDPGLTDLQLKVLLDRSNSLIEFILRLHQEGK